MGTGPSSVSIQELGTGEICNPARIEGPFGIQTRLRDVRREGPCLSDQQAAPPSFQAAIDVETHRGEVAVLR